MATAPCHLIAEHLQFAWPGQTPLIPDLSFDLGPGLHWLVGDEGCGKTTVLRLLAGELVPGGGRLCANGHWLDASPADYRAQVTWVTVQGEAHDAISAAAFLDSMARHFPRFSAEALADMVDGLALAPHLHKPMYMLSTGSRRKVALAAALASGQPLTLIDQPFAALDGGSIRFLREVFADLADHPTRTWVVADFEAPAGAASTIHLPGR